MNSKRIVIDKHTSEFAFNNKNAFSKARLDIDETFRVLGGRVHTIRIKRINNRMGILSNICQYLKCTLSLKFGSNVYIQFPAPSSRLDYYNVLIKYAKLIGCKVIYIVHDIESLRFTPHLISRECEVLNQADILIVHTDAMRDRLREVGIIKKMVVLNLFDYYYENTERNTIAKDDRFIYVAFAGNLQKSAFLSKLMFLNTKRVRFKLYGAEPIFDISTSLNSKYCGSFLPNQISIIDASWGLVWDGAEIESCEGIGNYLRYNSSHKISLYLAAGLPLIVWSESALARYIKYHNIGICVSSLLDIDVILSEISSTDYLKMKENVKKFSLMLNQGEMLISAINQCEQ